MPQQPSALPYEDTSSKESQARLKANRRAAVRLLLHAATSSTDLAFLSSELELDAELDELAATSAERQRLLELARGRLDEELPRLV